jgi:hypothetical protein
MNMKRIIGLVLLMAIMGFAANSGAGIIDSADDVLDSGIGNFAYISGTSGVPSSPGQIYDVLTLQKKNSETGSKTISMGQLYNTLSHGGIDSTSCLVFGFGLNEPGNNNNVTIQDLGMSFERANGAIQTYALGDEGITISGYNQGNGTNTAEALIQVNLGFDFMQEYSSDSTKEFTITSTIDNTSAGAEVYFLSSAYTANPPSPVPLNSTLLLLGTGFIGCLGVGKKTNLFSFRSRPSS